MSGRIFQNVCTAIQRDDGPYHRRDRRRGHRYRLQRADGHWQAMEQICGSLSMRRRAPASRWRARRFKALPGWGSTFDYAVFATGDDSMSRTVCSMAAVALNAAKNYYEEKHDKGSFIKNIISDNILHQ